MAGKKKPTSPTPISSHSHVDTRPNIPTEELRDFIAEDEKKPKTMLYPRDPSLDPQLVWKGKDEQDAAGFGSSRSPRLHPGAYQTAGHHRKCPLQRRGEF